MGKLRGLASDTAYYGLSSIVGRAINFLLVPFYTSVGILAVGEYGSINVVYAYIAVFLIVNTFGLETTYFRFVSRHADDEKKIFDSSLTVVISITLLCSALLFIFDTQIISWMGFPGKEIYLHLSALIVAIDSIVAIPFAKLRYQRKPKLFAKYKIINILITVFLNVFFLYFCKNIHHSNFLAFLKPAVDSFYRPDFNEEYVFIANLIANSLFIPMLWNIFKDFRPGIVKKHFKKMMLYSYPLVFAGLAGVTNELFSRQMLIKWLPEGLYPDLTNKEVVGVFSAVYKLSIFLTLAIQAFRYAAEPFFFAQSAAKDSKETFARIFYYFTIIGSLAVLAVSLNLDILKVIFLRNPVYWQGLYVVPILLVANLFLGFYINISIWFKLTDKTHFGTYIAVGGAILTVSLNYLLIPLAGYLGSSIATLVVYFFMMTAVYLLGQKFYPIPYNIKAAVVYFTFAMLLLLTGWYTDSGNVIINQVINELLILVFIATVYGVERKRLKFISK